MRLNAGLNLGYRWRYWPLLVKHFLRENGKMAAGSDDFWVAFGIYSQMCYPSLPNNKK